MNTIEDLLDQACVELHQTVESMPVRPASELRRRLSQRRVVTVTAAAVVVFASFGSIGLLFAADSASPRASQAAEVTTTLASTNEAAAPAPLSALPALGVDLTGWVAVDVTEEDGADGGFRAISYYLPDDQGSPAVVVKLRIRGIPQGSPHEATLWWMTRSDYTAVTVHGHDARMFATNGDIEYGWRESEDAVVTLSVLAGSESVTTDEAATIAA
ncbi:MAG: hypothetical protein WEB67_09380, partial [Acidimicrobiia bacterium]